MSFAGDAGGWEGVGSGGGPEETAAMDDTRGELHRQRRVWGRRGAQHHGGGGAGSDGGWWWQVGGVAMGRSEEVRGGITAVR